MISFGRNKLAAPLIAGVAVSGHELFIVVLVLPFITSIIYAIPLSYVNAAESLPKRWVFDLLMFYRTLVGRVVYSRMFRGLCSWQLYCAHILSYNLSAKPYKPLQKWTVKKHSSMCLRGISNLGMCPTEPKNKHTNSRTTKTNNAPPALNYDYDPALEGLVWFGAYHVELRGKSTDPQKNGHKLRHYPRDQQQRDRPDRLCTFSPIALVTS